MSIDQTEHVDIIGLEKDTGDVILTITDHLPWDEEEHTHLLLPREKISAYFDFIESGELLESYPEAADREVTINMVGKYSLSDKGQEFFNQAVLVAEKAGFKLIFELFEN